MKDYQKYLNEAMERKIAMASFLLDDGTVKDGDGWTEEGIGIFDNEGNEYSAGWDAEGNAYVSSLDSDNTLLGMDGERLEGIKLSNDGQITKDGEVI